MDPDFNCSFGKRTWQSSAGLDDCGILQLSSPKAWGVVSGHGGFGNDGGEGGRDGMKLFAFLSKTKSDEIFFTSHSSHKFQHTLNESKRYA